MLKLLFAMVIPICVFIYTLSFGRWMHKKKQIKSAVSAYMLALTALAVSGIVLWRIFL